MTFNDYQTAAMRTYMSDLSGRHVMTNGALGLCGEAGEVADIVKKHLYPSKVGDGEATAQRLIAELGDVLWYVSILCTALGVSMGEVAERNIVKLAERHGVEGR